MNPVFVDHFRNPRFGGRLSAPDVQVSVSNPVCGDELSLGLQVEGQTVREVGCEVRGCSGAIAAVSAMAELLAGTTVQDARRLDRDAIDQALGGLPTLKRHGADLAAKGLFEALAALPAGEST